MSKETVDQKLTDAYGAVYRAGANGYHFVKSLQENSEEEVVAETRRDIQRESPDVSYVDAELRACIEFKCMCAAAAGDGRAKRVREALRAQKKGTAFSNEKARPMLAKA